MDGLGKPTVAKILGKGGRHRYLPPFANQEKGGNRNTDEPAKAEARIRRVPRGHRGSAEIPWFVS